MNMWSSACLEARENVLLLILLPVFDTGSFIANLYLPYLLDELRGLVIRQHGFSFLFWYRFGSGTVFAEKQVVAAGIRPPLMDVWP